ncbi:MAG: DUF1634 domain-containing protein [Thermodesulfobacteriota bacterium]
MSEITKEATQEQLLYANILEKGMFLGLVSMVITFCLYVFGIMPAVVPVGEVANYWKMPVGQYLDAINQNFLHWEHVPTGWSWLKLVGHGDFLNFVPVAILSGVTIICYLAVVPGLFQRKDKAMGAMALATAIILALAASGLVGGGAH